MPILDRPCREALAAHHVNPSPCWYHPQAPSHDPDGPFAFQRLNQTFFRPFVAPGFEVRDDDRFFTMGSCFAWEIEKVLVRQGRDVVSLAREFEQFVVDERYRDYPFASKFNSFAMLYELRWALDPSARYPEPAVLRLRDDFWYDPHGTAAMYWADRQKVYAARRTMSEIVARIRDCRVVVLTPGLSEAWFDTLTGHYLNWPTIEILRRYGDRFRFHVLSYEEIFGTLEEIHALITRYGRPDVQIVTSVSPVPLDSTFRTCDIVTANAYSKAVLRAAVEAWSLAHPNVHYFPSYEIATLSDKPAAWEEDRRHVSQDLVDHIVGVFSRAYGLTEVSAPAR